MGLGKYRIILIVISIAAIAVCPGESTGDDLGRLNKLISSFEDQLIDSHDLAFFLATHSYDATPKSGYVEVKLNDVVYRLIPNEEEPGLCSISI